MAKDTTEAARRFFNLAFPNESWDATDNRAKNLIDKAFRLYGAEYNFNCMSWVWPANTLAEGDAFDGDEPWTVLLRRAMELRARR